MQLPDGTCAAAPFPRWAIAAIVAPASACLLAALLLALRSHRRQKAAAAAAAGKSRAEAVRRFVVSTADLRTTTAAAGAAGYVDTTAFVVDAALAMCHGAQNCPEVVYKGSRVVADGPQWMSVPYPSHDGCGGGGGGGGAEAGGSALWGDEEEKQVHSPLGGWHSLSFSSSAMALAVGVPTATGGGGSAAAGGSSVMLRAQPPRKTNPPPSASASMISLAGSMSNGAAPSNGLVDWERTNLLELCSTLHHPCVTTVFGGCEVAPGVPICLREMGQGGLLESILFDKVRC